MLFRRKYALFKEAAMYGDIREHPDFDSHKAVHIFCDQEVGLLAIVAIHNDDLGPAIGGTRVKTYSSFEDALTDALRLSAAMTRKAAAAELKYGGGKAVIVCDPEDKTPALLRSFADKINSLNGQFFTGGDMNIGVTDIETMAKVTRYIGGRSTVAGGGGDSAIMTAFGVFRGIQACLTHHYGYGGVHGRTIAIQGLGKVGFRLAKLLYQHGATMIVVDPDPYVVNRTLVECKGMGIRAVEAEEIYDQECDVFAPCAVGAVINQDTIPRLKCRIVAGAANNQLARPADGYLLAERGIIYAPDYVINAGGLINIAAELQPGGYKEERARSDTGKIYERILTILNRSRKESIPPHEIAESMVKDILERARLLKQFYQYDR